MEKQNTLAYWCTLTAHSNGFHKDNFYPSASLTTIPNTFSHIYTYVYLWK